MKIAVYCGSGLGNNPNYVTKTKELGKWMAQNGHALIYGGGDEGLMGVIAQEVFEGDGEVIGVLPGDIPFIYSREQPYCTQILVEDTMNARKQKMLEMADAFIALPGGIGTLDELSEVITLTKIGKFSKVSVCFNIDGFYDPFKNFLEKMIECEFLKEEDLDHVLFSDSLQEIEEKLHV